MVLIPGLVATGTVRSSLIIATSFCRFSELNDGWINILTMPYSWYGYCSDTLSPSHSPSLTLKPLVSNVHIYINVRIHETDNELNSSEILTIIPKLYEQQLKRYYHPEEPLIQCKCWQWSRGQLAMDMLHNLLFLLVVVLREFFLYHNYRQWVPLKDYYHSYRSRVVSHWYMQRYPEFE